MQDSKGDRALEQVDSATPRLQTMAATAMLTVRYRRSLGESTTGLSSSANARARARARASTSRAPIT